MRNASESGRRLPPPDPYASCPFEGNIVDYYRGTFEAVYVALNPFIRPVGVDRDLFRPGAYPIRGVVLTACEAVSWRSAAAMAGMTSFRAVDVGLRTLGGGLSKERHRLDYAEQLEAMMEVSRTVQPVQGRHADMLQVRVLDIFHELGYEWVWVGDELCTERKLHWIDDLRRESKSSLVGACNVFSPDRAMLWTTHWDSHWALLCSDNTRLSRAQVADRLEGFYCNEETDVYWGLQQADEKFCS